MRILYRNLIDASDVTIAASSEGSDLPAVNVAHPFRSRVWRTGTSIANEWIKFDLGSAMAVQAVILLDHTLTGADSLIRLQGNATDAWDAPAVEESLEYNERVLKHYLSPSPAYR